MPQDGVHTRGAGAWHECGRCGRKAKLNKELMWQMGVLVCRDCKDRHVIGYFDASLAQAMSAVNYTPDLSPNEKLTNPDIQSSYDDIFI